MDKLTLDPKVVRRVCRENKKNWPKKSTHSDASHERVRASWSKLGPKTYMDLVALYVMFLGGCIPGTPSYTLTSLTSDIDPRIAGYLIEINKLQFLTIDSQPGIKHDTEYQREYVYGFFPKRKMQSLFNVLVSQGNVEIGIVTDTKSGSYLRKHMTPSPNPVKATPYRGDTPELALTITGEESGDGFEVFTSLEIDKTKDGSWVTEGFFESSLTNVLYYTSDQNLRDWCFNNLCLVRIFAKEWGSNGALAEELLRALRSISIRMLKLQLK